MYYITVLDPKAIIDENGNYKSSHYFLAFDWNSGTRFWAPWYMEFFKDKEEVERVLNDAKKYNYFRDEQSKTIDINSIEIKEFKD